MTRLLEFIVALVIVAVLGVVVGVAMPSTGHVEREMLISKDLRQVYDVFSNFRRSQRLLERSLRELLRSDMDSIRPSQYFNQQWSGQ